MFELNDDLHVKEETILNSKVYTVDNFYKNPEEVFDYLFNRDVPLWKAEQKPSFNTVYFNDRRLIQREPRLIPVYEFLSKLCKQRYPNFDISTNMTKFLNHDFNDYNNCFWWPHIDGGYNGIVYLNEGEEDSGTNLYDPKVLDSFEWSYSMSMPEQYLCWRPKEKYSVVKSFKSRYNSLCLFDGSKFPHGMNITNNVFFSQYRCNQVFFFYP